MEAALELNSFLATSKLLLQTHREDAIFSVVSIVELATGQRIVYGAVPCAFQNSFRWAVFPCVETYFKNPNCYLTGSEAAAAAGAHAHMKTFIVCRNNEEISLLSAGVKCGRGNPNGR